MKGILKSRGKTAPLPETAVPSSAVGGQLHGHAGFPEATDSLAYDAVQRLISASYTGLHEWEKAFVLTQSRGL